MELSIKKSEAVVMEVEVQKKKLGGFVGSRNQYSISQAAGNREIGGRSASPIDLKSGTDGP